MGTGTVPLFGSRVQEKVQRGKGTKWEVHVIMSGNVFHVMALGEQNIDLTKIGISDNF